ENQIDVTIELEINNENFTNSNLQGADLVIIPSPNLREDKTSNVDTDSRTGEEAALEEFLSIGGSILYMSNPYSDNSSIAGHYIPLNDLIVDGLGFNVLQGEPGNVGNVLDRDNVTVIIDDFNNDGNSSRVYFTDEYINGDIWDTELNKISKVLYYGSQITDNSASPHNGNASALTYAVDKEYTITTDDLGNIKWMSGSTFGENDGRAVLIGSTIMFSDLQYENETAWIDVEDNQELFENLVAWLLSITPLNKPAETINSNFSYYLTRNVLLSVLLPLALLVLVFGTLIKTNTISLNNIFTFRVKRKATKKSKIEAGEKKTSKKSKKKTTKKTTKKQRRKRN
ncbi:MAG: hypothetical protein ACC656_01540, partial [Candidatus Heimdallarchaeota archaeon]